MSKQYPFKKKDVRDCATDMRATLIHIENCMRVNEYTFWQDLQNDVIDIAKQLTMNMRGK